MMPIRRCIYRFVSQQMLIFKSNPKSIFRHKAYNLQQTNNNTNRITQYTIYKIPSLIPHVSHLLPIIVYELSTPTACYLLPIIVYQISTPTAYRLPPIIIYQLSTPTAYYLTPTAYCLLLSMNYPLQQPNAYRLLPIIIYQLSTPTAYYLTPATYCLKSACPFGSGFPLQSFVFLRKKTKGFPLQSLTRNPIS